MIFNKVIKINDTYNYVVRKNDTIMWDYEVMYFKNNRIAKVVKVDTYKALCGVVVSNRYADRILQDKAIVEQRSDTRFVQQPIKKGIDALDTMMINGY